MRTKLFRDMLILCVLGSPLLSMTQCKQFDEPEIQEEKKTVTLTIRGEQPVPSDTKTYLGENGAVVWEEYDAVCINGEYHQVTPDPEDPTKGIVNGVTEADEYFATYPDPRMYDYNSIGVWISTDQYYKNIDGHSDLSGNPMVAYSTTPELSFRNVGGIVRLGITGDAEIVNITMTSNDDTPLSGTIQIPLEDIRSGELKDSYSFYDSDFYYYKSIYDAKVSLGTEPEYFYFIIAPGTYENGFSFYITDSDGNTSVKRTARSITVNRSHIVPMEDFEFTLMNPEVDASTVSPQSSSVSFTVNGEPGMIVRTAIVSTAVLENYPTEKEKYEFARQALDVSDSENKVVNTAGTADFGWDRYMDHYGAMNGMLAGTGYTIVASYYDPSLGTCIGIPAFYDFTTEEGEGAAPEVLEFRLDGFIYNGGDRNGYNFTISTANATGLRIAVLTTYSYRTLASTGFSDTEILMNYGAFTDDPEIVTQANGGGCSLSLGSMNFPWVYPETEYTAIGAAMGEDGQIAIKTDIRTSPEYIPENAVWEPAAADGELYFDVYVEETGRNIWFTQSSLTVEKLQDRLIYRVVFKNDDQGIRDMFEEAGLRLTDDGEKKYIYFHICENMNGTATIFPLCSYIGFDTPGQEELFAVANSLGSCYIEDNGFTNLDIPVSLCYPGEDRTVLEQYAQGNIRLYFTGPREGYVSGGIGTEDFIINGNQPW